MRRFKVRHARPLYLQRSLSISSASPATVVGVRPVHHETGNIGASCPGGPDSIQVANQMTASSESTTNPVVWYAGKTPAPAVGGNTSESSVTTDKFISTIPRSLATISSLASSVGGNHDVKQLKSFNNGFFLSKGNGDKDPVDERKLRLGKTIDILKDRLPTLLESPLPSEILSPSISLRLFPTTHPHLPTVRGRMAYIAALWTSPMVWGRIPGVKVRLEILSVKMAKLGTSDSGLSADSSCGSSNGEQMIVKWRASPNGNGDEMGTTTGSSSTSAPSKGESRAENAPKEDALSAVTSSLPKFNITGDFCGLFIFEFDDKGRIKTHIIEDVEAEKGEAKAQHSKVITLTEWLLKKAKGSLEEKPAIPGLAFERLCQDRDVRR